jgi:hypothetical protein
MTRPYARSNAEAHLYMDLYPCACGERDFDRRSAVINEHGTLCSRYAGPCARCATQRTFVFEIPEAIRPVQRDHVEYGGDDPSRIIDAGEWMAVSDAHARREPHARRDLDIARAAIEEVQKFLPKGLRGYPTDRVPDDAFWTARGRAVRDAAPANFGRLRLSAALELYQRMHEQAPASAPVDRPPVAYPPPDAPHEPASLPALTEALATAIAKHHGFDDDELHRQVSYLTGELQSVARRFEIRAREVRTRMQTTAEVERILDGIIRSGSQAGAQIAPHRETILSSLRGVDLVRLTESLQVLVEWIRNPSDAQPIETVIANLASAVDAAVSPEPQPGPAAAAQPPAAARPQTGRSLDQVFPGNRKDPR